MKGWELTPEVASAAHDSGLIVRYQRLPMTSEEEEAQIDDALFGEFSTTDGRAWAMMTTDTPSLTWPSHSSGVICRARNGAHQFTKMSANRPMARLMMDSMSH